MNPLMFLRSNLLAWGVILLAFLLPGRWAPATAVALGLMMFIAREWSDLAAANRRARHALKVSMADIRQMQEKMPLRRLDSEEDFYLGADGRINWAKKARIQYANHLVDACIDGSARILDVGCGDGLLTRRLAARGERVVGMDISGNLVRYMLSWVGQDHVFGVEGDAESLPFAGRSFDLVVLTETLEHLLDPSHALEEIRGLLQREAHLVVTVPNKNRLTLNPFTLIRSLWGSFISRRYRHRNEALFHGKARMFFVHNAFRPRDLHLLAKGAGLGVVESGSFHLTLLDRLRASSPELASGLERVLLRLPVIGHFGRYSYAVMQPLMSAHSALDGERADP